MTCEVPPGFNLVPDVCRGLTTRRGFIMDPADRLLCGVLWGYAKRAQVVAGKTPFVYVGYQTLADEIGAARRTVNDQARRLEREGWMVRCRRKDNGRWLDGWDLFETRAHFATCGELHVYLQATAGRAAVNRRSKDGRCGCPDAVRCLSTCSVPPLDVQPPATEIVKSTATGERSPLNTPGVGRFDRLASRGGDLDALDHELAVASEAANYVPALPDDIVAAVVAAGWGEFLDDAEWCHDLAMSVVFFALTPEFVEGALRAWEAYGDASERSRAQVEGLLPPKSKIFALKHRGVLERLLLDVRPRKSASR